jgi:hypothetical protein
MIVTNFALKHKKEKLSNASLGMLDPATVLSLFRRMTDEDCWQHLQLQVVEYINSDEPRLTNNTVALINDSKGRPADFVVTCLENVLNTLEGLSYLLIQI